jgi:dihydroorotate dehydrogenase electron transfer subunit
MKKKQSSAEVLVNKKIKAGYFKVVLRSPLIAKTALPGQFVMLKVAGGVSLEPFLRRPLGIHGIKSGQIEIIYEVVGKGTDILSRRKPGEVIDLLGPLGNSFDYQSLKISNRQPILVAGGIGVAPLMLLAERLVAGNRRAAIGKVQVLIGARAKEQVLCEKEFKKIGCDVKIATDDGSAGFSGRVTALLEEVLLVADYRLPAIYGCGPKPMLRELARICRKKNIPAQVSLEAHMACGIGACLGCVVSTKNGYKRVCKDGPVFETENLIY